MKTYLILLAFISVLTSCIYTQDLDDGDFQIWNETTVYFKSIKKKDENGKDLKFISPFVLGTLRYGQNVEGLATKRIGVGFDIQLNKYFKLTPSYYYIYDQPSRNTKAIEHRPRIDLTAEKKWNKFSLSNRNRFEFRIRNNRSDSVRYRNKTTLKIPINNKDGKEIITPFVADEPYYDFQRKEWSRNEFSVGLGKKINNKFSAEFFYLLQNNKGSAIKTVNAIGVNFKINLD